MLTFKGGGKVISKKKILNNIKILNEEHKKIRQELKREKEHNNGFANAMLLLRKQKGWTQDELACKIKKQRGESVSTTYISYLEIGQALPCPGLLKQLSKVFGCGYEFLKDFLENDKVGKCKKEFNKKYRR